MRPFTLSHSLLYCAPSHAHVVAPISHSLSPPFSPTLAVAPTDPNDLFIVLWGTMGTLAVSTAPAALPTSPAATTIGGSPTPTSAQRRRFRQVAGILGPGDSFGELKTPVVAADDEPAEGSAGEGADGLVGDAFFAPLYSPTSSSSAAAAAAAAGDKGDDQEQVVFVKVALEAAGLLYLSAEAYQSVLHVELTRSMAERFAFCRSLPLFERCTVRELFHIAQAMEAVELPMNVSP